MTRNIIAQLSHPLHVRVEGRASCSGKGEALPRANGKALGLFLAALAVLSCSLPASADTSIRYDLKIQPQPLGQALQEFAKQSGIQIIFFSKLTEGHAAPALNGKYTPESALGTLLGGTDLTFHQLNGKTIEVQPKAAIRKAASTTSSSAPLQPTSYGAMTGEPQGPLRLSQAEDQNSPTSAASAKKEKSPHPSKDESANKPEPEVVVVTGSRLPGTAKEGAQEIKVYTREKIEQSGQTNVQDFLSTLPEVSVNNPENGFGAFNGATTVQLHGLPVGTTLVLINGRRVEVAGAQAAFNVNIFDLNNIPLSAVERIEVVPQGSSAIYGSDAIAGVVNVILKQDFDGFEQNTKYSWASGTNEWDASLAWGKHFDKGNVSIVGSFQNRGELEGFERLLTSTDNKTAFGGSDQRLDLCNPGNVISVNGSPLPGLGAATFAAVPAGFTGPPSQAEFAGTANTLNRCSIGGYSSLIPATRRSGLFASANYEALPDVTLFAEMLFSYTQELTVGDPPGFFAEPGFSQFTVSASNPYNPFHETVGTAYLFTGVGRQPSPLDTLFSRPLIGAKGELPASWHWELAGWLAQDHTDYALENAVNNTAAQAALNSSDPATALNVFSAGPPGSPQLIQSILGNLASRFLGQTIAANGFVAGPVLHMPSGTLDVVLGSEYAHEKFNSSSDTVLTGIPAYSGFQRTRYAVFGEARIPILGNHLDPQAGDTLAVTAAARNDHYDDFGSKTTPQIGAEWRPTESLLVRGTYGKAFKAPSLVELHEPDFASQEPLTDPEHGNSVVPVSITSGGNTRLRPETGQSRTFGLVYANKETPGLQASVTYWAVDETDSIQNLDPQVLVDNESEFPGQVIRNAAGILTQVDTTYLNFGLLKVSGFDYQLSYQYQSEFGTWSPSLNATQTNRYTAELIPGTAPTDRTSIASSDGNFAPRWKGTVALSWKSGNYAAGIDGRYIGRYLDYQDIPNNNILGNIWYYDANFHYAIGQAFAAYDPWLKNAYVGFAAVNLFNRMPRFSFSDFGNFGYDNSEYDIRGRFVSVQFGLKM